VSIELRWLGQAGFAIRSATTTVVVDPYLSDLCLSVHGLQRQITAPATPASLGAQAVLVSHWHEDHLDLDSATEFADSGAVFVAPPSCIARLAGKGIATSALTPITPGQTVTIGGAAITATPARHMVAGFLTEDAVGYLIEVDGVRIYHSGDTDYDRSLLAATDRGPLDVALLCVNGTGGNMNAWEAAALAAQLTPALAVPIHFGMWPVDGYGPGATLDPDQFRQLYQQLSDGAAVAIPDVNHPITVPR
jgi:L-ascorbate 6-phosphate lactonase